MIGKTLSTTTSLLNSEGAIVLHKSRQITEQDVQDFPEIWKGILDNYKNTDNQKNAVSRALVSVVNSIIYQRRLIFIITRDQLLALVKGDKNWPTEKGFQKSVYQKIIASLCKYGLIKLYKKATHARMPNVYEVVDNDILAVLLATNIDRETQCKETNDFIEKYFGDHKRDHKRDVGKKGKLVSKNKVTSITEEGNGLATPPTLKASGVIQDLENNVVNALNTPKEKSSAKREKVALAITNARFRDLSREYGTELKELGYEGLSTFRRPGTDSFQVTDPVKLEAVGKLISRIPAIQAMYCE